MGRELRVAVRVGTFHALVETAGTHGKGKGVGDVGVSRFIQLARVSESALAQGEPQECLDFVLVQMGDRKRFAAEDRILGRGWLRTRPPKMAVPSP